MKSNHNANDETKGESLYFVATLHTVFILFYPCLMIMIAFHYTNISLHWNEVRFNCVYILDRDTSNKENASPNILI